MSKQIRIGCIGYDAYSNLCQFISRLCLQCYDNVKPGIDYEIMRYSLEYGLGSSALQQADFSLVRFESIGSLVNYSNRIPEYDGFIGALHRNIIDIAIPTINIDHTRLKVITYPTPAAQYDSDSYLVNPIDRSDMPPNFFKVLKLQTWLVGFSLFFLMSFAIVLIFHVRDGKFKELKSNQKSELYSGLSFFRYLIACQRSAHRPQGANLFDAAFSILFEKRSRHKWSIPKNMLLITVWSLCAIMGVRLFAAFYVRGLTPVLSYHPFSSLQELANLMEQKEYKLVMLNSGLSYESMQPGSTDEQWSPIRQASKINPPVYVQNYSEGLQWTRNFQGAVYYTSNLLGTSLAERSSLVNIVLDANSMGIYSFAMRQRFAYVNQLAMGYLLTQEYGLADKIYRKYGIPLGLDKKVERLETDLKPLSMDQVKEAFTILIAGFGFCVTSFIIETLLASNMYCKVYIV